MRPATAKPAARTSVAAALAGLLLLAAACAGPGRSTAPAADREAAAGSETAPAGRETAPPENVPADELLREAEEAPAADDSAEPAVEDSADPDGGSAHPGAGAAAEPLDEAKIFLVELGTGEAGGAPGDEAAAGAGFGCGDRLRAVTVPVDAAGPGTAADVAAALRALLAAESRGPAPRGLRNALADSELRVERVEEVAGVPGLYRVELAGELRLGGVCDHPRVQAQLRATALQFDGVDDVELWLGEQTLDRALSLRGGD